MRPSTRHNVSRFPRSPRRHRNSLVDSYGLFMLARFLPLATPFDSAEDPPGSIDPLGTVAGAEQLADVLFSGMTARMWRRSRPSRLICGARLCASLGSSRFIRPSFGRILLSDSIHWKLWLARRPPSQTPQSPFYAGGKNANRSHRRHICQSAWRAP
jgi:hypothetical protein